MHRKKKTMVQQITELDQEILRIESEYRRRNSGIIPADRYSYFNEAALLHAQSMERNLLALLKHYRFTCLREKKILDVGCGGGGVLLRFFYYGSLFLNLFFIVFIAHHI